MIEKEIYIDAPPEVVYGFLTEPAKMMQWIGTEVELDPRPGGVFRVVPNLLDVISGEFRAAIPYSNVSFTWGFEGDGQGVPPGSTIVEITLEPEGAGTRLRLTHRDLTGESREKHDGGWDHYLARIAVAVEGGAVVPDPYADPSHRHV
ncbi:MAG TPA: SRPBCC domain-containing protein [Candidatus Elarobacter sp.]|jgi:uncharacterized protein YndB with AHSA1/START domain|nr:SRPBCC domain-containing protein [Candidatus Elarobacter sp.]